MEGYNCDGSWRVPVSRRSVGNFNPQARSTPCVAIDEAQNERRRIIHFQELDPDVRDFLVTQTLLLFNSDFDSDPSDNEVRALWAEVKKYNNNPRLNLRIDVTKAREIMEDILVIHIPRNRSRRRPKKRQPVGAK